MGADPAGDDRPGRSVERDAGGRRRTPAGRPPRRRARPGWRDVFLATLRDTGNVAYACRTADVCRSTAYLRRDKDPKFASLWDDALEDGLDLLEAVARRRAIEGSDTLLIFLLKANRPEKYRDRYPLETLVQRLTSTRGGAP